MSKSFDLLFPFKISKSFDQLFSELVTLFTSQASYEKSQPKVDIESIESIESIQQQLIQLLKGKNTIDDITISDISAMLNNIFSSQEFSVDFSGLGDYLREYINLPQTACSHFVDNSDCGDEFEDTDKIPVEIMFKGMSCKSCGLFPEMHKSCSYYNITDRNRFGTEDCNTCGMSKYKHTTCSKFSGNNENDCTTCGRDLFDHQQKKMNLGNYPCNNFTSTDSDSCMDCKNCIHSETLHMLNQQLFKMNYDAYSKFTDTGLEFQTAFFELSDIEKVLKRDKYYEILRMNYSHQYPQYDKFM